jgi:pentatricopeptide repeat protein
MINLLGEQERWEGVEAMLSEMKEQGLVPNIITYTTLVDVYGRSGRYKEAIDCIEAMKADGLKPSPTMYHALVNAYAQRVRKFSTLCLFFHFGYQ